MAAGTDGIDWGEVGTKADPDEYAEAIKEYATPDGLTGWLGWWNYHDLAKGTAEAEKSPNASKALDIVVAFDGNIADTIDVEGYVGAYLATLGILDA